MYSPVSPLQHPIQMVRKRKQNARKATENARVNSLVKAVKQLKVSKKATPFKNTGGIIGNRIGGMFGNASMGRGIGRWLGTGIGSIFGSGDYTLSGSAPSYNVMTNGAQIPKFSSTRQTNIVCHREYLGDIVGTAAFTNTAYPLNPGMSVTFPWLSTVAANYQEYKIHGLIFEFRSLITDFVTGGAPGVIVMSTNYNSDAPNYTTKQQMENAEFAVATKPTINLMHGVECADRETILPQRYVRNATPPSGQDLRLYDMGNFQLATSSNPVQNLGELWVSYCVEFFKPIQATVTGIPGIGEITSRSGVTNVIPVGTTPIFQRGGLNVSFTGTGVTILNAIPAVRYKVDLYWTGNAVTWTFGGFALFNCSGVNYFNGGANPSFSAPANGTLLITTGEASTVVTSTLSVPGSIAVGVNAGVYPGSGAVEVFVTQLDPTV